MSPEYRENQKHKRYGPGRLLRLIASAAVLLVCVCLSTSHSYAWTEIPDWLLQQLPAEQQTLINALPEADRPMAYCYLSDTDALTFLKQYSGHADLIAREGLANSYRLSKYLTGSTHPDFSTPAGQVEKQFLMELYFALSGSFGSYRDLSKDSISVFYIDDLQNRTLAQLKEKRTSLDTGRVFNEEELPMWKSILDAWIAFRSGSAASQVTGAGSELDKAYWNAAYPSLDQNLQQLVNEMPETFKLLTFASVSGTDGLAWLREKSGVSFDIVSKYWTMSCSELDSAYSDLAKAGKADSKERQFILQLHALKAKTYPLYRVGEWGIDYDNTIRMQDFARSGDEIVKSYERIRTYLDENSASEFWTAGCDTELACKAWMAYFRRIAPAAIAESEARRIEAAEAAAQLAGLDWTAAQ